MKSLAAKHIFISLLILIFLIAAVYAGSAYLEHLKGEGERINLAGQLRFRSFEMAWLAHRLAGMPEQDERTSIMRELNREMAIFEEIIMILKNGDPKHSIQPIAHNAGAAPMFEKIIAEWQRILKPKLLEISTASGKNVFAPLREYDLTIHEYVYEIDKLVKVIASHHDREVEKFNGYFYYFGGIFVLISIFMLLFIKRMIIEPVLKLRDASSKIEKGDFNARVDIKSKDEIGALGCTFNNMTRTIGELINDKTRSLQELDVLNKIAKTASQSLSLEVMLDKTMDAILSFSPLKLHELAAVFLHDEQKGNLRLIVSRNFSDEHKRQCAFIRYGECLCGIAAEKKEILISENSALDSRHVKTCESEAHGHLILPLSNRDKMLGILCLYLMPGTKPSDREIILYRSIADIVSVSVENALNHKQVAMLAQSLESSSDVIVITDSEGRITYINPEATRQLGYSPDELMGKPVSIIQSPNNPPMLGEEIFQKTLKDGWFGEVINIRKDGSEYPALLTTSPVRDAGGKTIALIGIATDITERKQAEEALREHGRVILALNQASNSIMGITKTYELFNSICGNAIKLFDIRMVWIGLIDEGSYSIRPVAHAGFDDGYLSGINATWDDSTSGSGPAGMSIKTRKPYMANTNDPVFSLWADEAKKRGFASVLGVPLIVEKDECIGALLFYSGVFDYFSPDKINLCQVFANQAATAIENARLVESLEEKVEKRTVELESANMELKKLLNAIEYSAEAVVITDTNGTIEYVNPAFTATSGYGREEALGKNPRILNSGMNPKGLFKDMWGTILSGHSWEGTVINRKKTGEIYYEEMTVAPVLNEQSKIISFIAVKKDVTDRVKAEIELKLKNLELEEAKRLAEAASKTKSEFLANMSHELRTPLNSIIGFSQVLFEGMAGHLTDKQKEFLSDISESGNHLLSLINDILDLSKIEAGKVELELEEFNIKELIEGSLIMFKEKAITHRMKVGYTVDDGMNTIVADNRKLRQVIINLLGNAFKFTPAGGSVFIRAGRGPEGGVEFSVEDTGIGISREDQSNLFQPFQQLDTAYSRKYPGTGLGLHLCKRFIELHGGVIRVESRIGGGSKFIFKIPLSPKDKTLEN